MRHARRASALARLRRAAVSGTGAVLAVAVTIGVAVGVALWVAGPAGSWPVIGTWLGHAARTTGAASSTPSPGQSQPTASSDPRARKTTSPPPHRGRHSRRQHHHPLPPPGGLPGNQLTPANGTLFGAYAEPSGGSLKTAVAHLEQLIGRHLAINEIYIHFTWPMPLALARWDMGRGTIPLISWGQVSAAQVVSGKYDSLIRKRALELKSLRGGVLLRWFAEMDGQHNAAAAGSPGTYIAAWRHIHAIFDRVGATNVSWVWCPNAGGFTTGRAQRYYPGSSYVNWVGADGYNWGPERPRTPWRTFAGVFSAFYRWGKMTGKPLIVGEYGTVEGKPGAKAAWFRQAQSSLSTTMRAIRAVVYFNSRHENFGNLWFDWRVTTSASSVAAFRSFARSPYFTADPRIT
jgi:hypothetical protein